MKTYQRSLAEKFFLVIYLPAVLFGYLIYKYPNLFVGNLITHPADLYFFGKSPSFWYGLIYTAIVCGIAGSVLYYSRNPYVLNQKNPPLSTYQRSKWISIFFSQLIFFFILPFLVPGFTQEGGFFADPIKGVDKNAYIYVYRGFSSPGGFFYIFILVPLSVWFFGKRYCSWFCACGNLAETIGVTPWGASWVKHFTPRGEKAKKWESLQTLFLGFALFFGFILFVDTWKLFTVGNLPTLLTQFKDVVMDLMFGALVGVGAYPFLGTRSWCRYGCPLAKGMELFGRFSYSRFGVQANSNCKGINLCSQVCPMGIDVASYAHANKKPIEGSFGLKETLCIGCGGCISICPVKALEFKKILSINPPKETP